MIDYCKGTGCPIKENCARFTATPVKGFYFHPQYKDGECILFLPTPPKKNEEDGNEPSSCNSILNHIT